jgi:glutamine synthetase
MANARPSKKPSRARVEVPVGKPFPPTRLVGLIGKEPSFWSVDDLIRLYKDQGLRLASLMHVGGDGWLKTLDFVPRDEEHLRDILEGGERADGSSLFRGTGIETGRSDIVLRPRLESAFLDPFATLPTLAVLCGHFGRDGKPLPESPDTIVRAAHDRLLEKTAIDLMALGEVEYFLGKRPEESDVYGADDRGYHASSPFVFGEGLRRRALEALSEIGLPIKYGHSEVGYIGARDTDSPIWEQHEIELSLTGLPQAAEAVALTHWVLRNLAHKGGMRVSFDPIMRKGHAGSGLHFHFSPVVKGKHTAYKPAGADFQNPAKWLIGGLVELGPALMAFGNRTGGSFARLSQGKEAPHSVMWGEADRRALVRIPISATTAKGRLVSPPTIEFRLPDGSAHPYLLLAGVAQALVRASKTKGLGRVLEETHSLRLDRDHAAMRPIPRNFEDVALALREHRAVFEEGGVFPTRLIDRTLEKIAAL